LCPSGFTPAFGREVSPLCGEAGRPEAEASGYLEVTAKAKAATATATATATTTTTATATAIATATATATPTATRAAETKEKGGRKGKKQQWGFFAALGRGGDRGWWGEK